jgi:hypothetical protein
MKSLTIFLAALALLLVPACKSYYVSSDFQTTTGDHQTIAVLPFEMVYTGVKPDKLTEADMAEIANAESQAFQISFYNEILRSTRNGKKPIRVKLQDFKTTQNLLRDRGISLNEVGQESPERLAEILGVDAVVRGRIQKNRLMSDLASYGIEVGVRILDVLTNAPIWPWLPMGVTQSKEIRANYSLLDKDNGAVLWSISFDIDADWRQRSNDIIDRVNRRGAKKFPYREKGSL